MVESDSIFNENSYFAQMEQFAAENAKVQRFQKICFLDFSRFLCDDRHPKASESVLFFIFYNIFDCYQTTTLWTFLGTKFTLFIFLVSSLFNVTVLVLEPGVHCYFVLVFMAY